MKAFHMTLSAAVLGTLLAGAAFAQTATTPATSNSGTQATTQKDNDRKEDRAERHENMAKELGLTADQKAQMKSIHMDAKKQAEAIKADSSLSAEQKKAKLKELHEQTMQKSEALLTPEQKQKWEKERAEHKGKRMGRRHHRGQGQQH
jgi:periplasmic protein CpxP/Spy